MLIVRQQISLSVITYAINYLQAYAFSIYLILHFFVTRLCSTKIIQLFEWVPPRPILSYGFTILKIEFKIHYCLAMHPFTVGNFIESKTPVMNLWWCQFNVMCYIFFWRKRRKVNSKSWPSSWKQRMMNQLLKKLRFELFSFFFLSLSIHFHKESSVI